MKLGRISQAITGYLNVLDDAGALTVPLKIVMSYDTDDPYVVEFLFAGANVRWSIYRDLIISGLESSAGVGDVRVSTHGTVGGDTTILTLSNQDNAPSDFTLDTHELMGFLQLTEQMVPLGAETYQVQRQIDRTDWTRLMAGGAEAGG